MEYGAEILRQVGELREGQGALDASVDALRRNLEKASEDSSDRHKELREDLEELSEKSDARHLEVERLRALVERCPQHVPGAPDVPLSRVRKHDSTEHKAARRSIVKSVAAILGAIAAFFGAAWAGKAK